MKERYAVSDSNVIKLAQPGAFSDSLTEILRSGARALLTQAIEAEVAEFLAKHADLKTATGQQRVVRHGHLPERAIMTGIGPVAVRQPRVRDREATEGARIRYSPSILPRYARRSKSLGTGIGCAVTTRRSASAWRGIWRSSKGCRQRPMKPARSRLAGSARSRWCAIAAPTTRCRPPMATVRW
jgi:hypothetical protein